MKRYTTRLRALLLGAVGAAVWACSSGVEKCDSCSPGDGDSNSGDGDSGDGDTGDGDDGGGDGDDAVFQCTNPQASDTGNGLISCDEGYYHRAQSALCANILPRDLTVEWPEVETGAGGAGGAGNLPYTTSLDECSRDADCPELHYCVLYRTNPTSNDCHGTPEDATPDYARVCNSAGSGCVTDNDCENDQICACGTYAGHCVDISPIAGCRTDNDCEGEALCLAPQYACQLPGDECHSHSDCAAHEYCSLGSETGRTCRTTPEVVCGRPFLVDGGARLAPSVRCSNWQEKMSEIALPSDEILRAQLAAHFTEIGLMEHASIAAFARFTLQLLSLGAPAALIEASNTAIMDETRHARQAFALASAHAEGAVGPGRLPLEGAFEDISWEAILEATVREGCIGETRAALEASWAAEQCTDPVVREILQGIARDESEHAELAWRVVAWMVGQKPELASLLRLIFESAADLPQGGTTRPEGARAYGVLNHAELTECWKQAQREVIVPCALALLSKTEALVDRPKDYPMGSFSDEPTAGNLC